MKKIVVIGSTGMLGYAVTEYFTRKNYEVVPIGRKEFDIAKEPVDNLKKFINNAEAVINCAGVIKPRIAANTIEDVLKINSIFPRNLAELCNKYNVKCFHITTDCVYTGNKGRYDENDFFDAEDIYGITKNAGETKDCMVIRTSIIGEENGQSRSLLEWAKSQAGKEVNGFTNHLWNGVTTVYLAEIIETILERNLYQKGLLHVHSPNTVTKYELLQIFDKVYGLELKINSAAAKEACDRSMTSKYELSKKVSTKTLEEQVYEMREFFIANKISMAV